MVEFGEIFFDKNYLSDRLRQLNKKCCRYETHLFALKTLTFPHSTSRNFF